MPAAAERRRLYQATTDHFLAPVLPLLKDPDVSEVMINGSGGVYYEKAGTVRPFEGRFGSEAALMAAAQNIAEYVDRRLDADHHSMDARLPDGSRVHVVLPPASRQGVVMTIRKFREATFTLATLVEFGALSEAAAEFLGLCVKLHKNAAISGGTGTGKTSMLNALSAEIPAAERIIVIEDSSELRLHQPHTVYLEAQPPRPDGRGQVSIRDLFVDSLRMRPDRIIVGEVRRGEALDLIHSMLSGHAGSLTTVHANTPRDAAVRLETLCLMSDVGLPLHVARVQVASALHLVIQITRFADGSRKVRAISEMLGLDGDGNYQFRDLFLFEAAGLDDDGRLQGELKWTGARPSFADEVHGLGLGHLIKRTAPLFSDPAAPDGPIEDGAIEDGSIGDGAAAG